MSTGHVLTVDERNHWVETIRCILNTLYATTNRNVLYFLLVNIYEFSVACCAQDSTLPIKLKMLQNKNLGNDWLHYCLSLYSLRGDIVHAPYNINNGVLIYVLSSENFEILIKEFMPEIHSDFLDLILGYSKYI